MDDCLSDLLFLPLISIHHIFIKPIMYILRITTLSALFIFLHVVCIAQPHNRSDTLFIAETNVIPAINGLSDDAAWDLVDWQPIDQIWMPYDNESGNLGQEAGLQLWEGANDFTGKFKVVWSAETNLLYFLVDIIDDVFVDGYVYNVNPNQGGGYPNYDIVEVFIDEDRSGGLHVFDGTGSVANNWGRNAENAFAYHMAVNAPNDGSVETQMHALDIAGSNWGYPNQWVADYASHFPEFALRKDGNNYIWEFSLVVHDDSYDHDNQEASVVSLEPGKVMGLSLAYCDNDQPNRSPLRRNHFFGSVEVPLGAYNDHWKDADWFGVAKLVSGQSTSTGQIDMRSRIRSMLNGSILISNIQSDYTGKVNIRIMNLLGEVMTQHILIKDDLTMNHRQSMWGYPHGVYIIEIIQGENRSAEKFGYF